MEVVMSTLIVSSVGRCRRLVILALLIGSTAFAAPLAAAEIMITSGSLDMRPSAGTVILQGDRGFSLQGGVATMAGLFDPAQICNYLIGPCGPGDTIRLRGLWSSSDAPGVFTLDGVRYDSRNMTSTRLSFDGSIVLPPFPSDPGASTVLTAPFVFEGAVSALIAGGAGSVQERLVGAGVATLTLVPDRVIAGRWQFTQVLYEFGGIVPAPWVSKDIGGVGLTGTAVTFADKFVVTGAGSDIWGPSDAFRFVYQSAACAASVTARVTSEQPTHVYAKAGVMLRSSLDPSGSSITLDVKPDGGIELLVRYSDGEPTIYVGGGVAVDQDVFLRLSRSGGDALLAEQSADGVTWSPIGSVVPPFGTGDVLSGLAVTSHDVTRMNIAMFDHVAVTPCLTTQNLLQQGDFEGYEPPALGAPGWVSDDGLRQVPAKSETHQPRSGRINGACWTPLYLDCGIYQEVIAPQTSKYSLVLYASADRAGGFVGANVNGATAASSTVEVRPFADYALYRMVITANAGDVIRVWMYSPATPGYVVIDDVSLTIESASRTIAGGEWTIFMSGPPVGEFALSGDGFSIEGIYNAGLVVPAQTCATGCAPGQVVDLDAFFHNDTPVEFQSYSHGTAPGLGTAFPFVEFAGSLKLDGDPVTLPTPRGDTFPELVTVSAPFVLSGTLKGYQVVGVREPTLLFQVSLTGRGAATLKLLSGPRGDGGVQFSFYGLSYVFEP